jgi:hypothetical protein
VDGGAEGVDRGGEPQAERRGDAGVAANDVAFASVVVASPMCEERSRRALPGAPMIEVVVGLLTVRVPSGADPAKLQVVLRAVQAVS